VNVFEDVEREASKQAGSVLRQVELPILEQRSPAVEIIYHPIGVSIARLGDFFEWVRALTGSGRRRKGPPENWEGERPPFVLDVEVWSYTVELYFVRIGGRVAMADTTIDRPVEIELRGTFRSGEPLSASDQERAVAAIEWLIQRPELKVTVR
jgi:hypothetical protein